MNFRLVATAIVLAGAAPAIAGTENVTFPAGYKDDHVQYTTVDKSHPKRGHSVRVMYADKAAVAALKAGRKLPSGTVLTMEVYRAKIDAAKNPVKDASGRFVKDKLFGVFVMEKRDGWGGEYPASLRNGNWGVRAVHGGRDAAQEPRHEIVLRVSQTEVAGRLRLHIEAITRASREVTGPIEEGGRSSSRAPGRPKAGIFSTRRPRERSGPEARQDRQDCRAKASGTRTF